MSYIKKYLQQNIQWHPMKFSKAWFHRVKYDFFDTLFFFVCSTRTSWFLKKYFSNTFYFFEIKIGSKNILSLKSPKMQGFLPIPNRLKVRSNTSVTLLSLEGVDTPCAAGARSDGLRPQCQQHISHISDPKQRDSGWRPTPDHVSSTKTCQVVRTRARNRSDVKDTVF